MKLGLARTNCGVWFNNLTDFALRGILFTKFKFGAAAGRTRCDAPAFGPYSLMTASTDLLAIPGAKFRTIDVGLTYVDWISDGTTWRPQDPIMVNGSPLGVITAPVGSLAISTAGGAATTLYVKESATDATGWVAK